MTSNSNPMEAFENIGGVLCTPLSVFKQKLDSIKAIILDWDGVFNTGTKHSSVVGSDFNEADSMGLNMLRFSFWLKNNQSLPPTAIITGENNSTSFDFAKRECFNQVYFKVADKRIALEHFCESNGIVPSEVVFFFDDILDLNVASQVGLRMFLPRKNAPLFNEYVRKNNLADYCSAQGGGQYGIREICELLIAHNNNFDSVIEKRMQFEGEYSNYLAMRKQVNPTFRSAKTGVLKKVNINE